MYNSPSFATYKSKDLSSGPNNLPSSTTFPHYSVAVTALAKNAGVSKRIEVSPFLPLPALHQTTTSNPQ